LTDLQEEMQKKFDEIKEPSLSLKKVDWKRLETSTSVDKSKQSILKRKNLARKTVDFRSYNVSPTAFYDFQTEPILAKKRQVSPKIIGAGAKKVVKITKLRKSLAETTSSNTSK